MMMIRTTLSTAALALLLGGCASLNHLSNDVTSYGAWPSERKPTAFAFDRLPSQQARAEQQQALEDAARGALLAAGFGPAVAMSDADYLVQIGARVSAGDPWYDADPFWYGSLRLGYGRGFGRGPWMRGPWGPGWGGWGGYGYYAAVNYEREVAVVIRDRRSGQVLYETRASNSGPSASIDRLLPAMFQAAMKDFPAVSPMPHAVTVQLSSR